jgi:short-subunit dehydrogenase
MSETASSIRQPVALITGASAGIGAEFARVFARHGHQLVLVARREQRLHDIADEIAASGLPRPHVLAVDLSVNGASKQIAAELARLNVEPQYVVNNAGFGLIGLAVELEPGEQLAMIDLNVRMLTELSLAFIGSLGRHRGGILNVASVASFLPGPGMAVYFACKAFVLSFTEALHQELSGQGIRVTVLCPGVVPTEFQARAGMKKMPMAKFLCTPPADIAEAGYAALMQGQRVAIPGVINKLITFLPRILPRGFFLCAVARSQLSQFDKSHVSAPLESSSPMA